MNISYIKIYDQFYLFHCVKVFTKANSCTEYSLCYLNTSHSSLKLKNYKSPKANV